MALSFQPIRSLIQTGTRAGSRLFSYVGLGIGVLLLLCSIQMFINIQQLLGSDTPREAGYDFISISKTITNETMGQLDKNLFDEADIQELRAQPFTEAVSPLIANRFRVQLSAGNIIPFSTDLFVESLDNSFIDTVPPEFTWHVGQDYIPIIFSSDFLEMYNVFAPGYGLPQISEATASQVVVFITCFSEDGSRQTFRGSIVALSDRINSIIVPKSFLEWGNKTFGNTTEVKASRLYIKMNDANDPDFLNFLAQKNYKVNKDKTKFGRIKQVLQGIFSGLGVFGLMVVVLAFLLFSFYLQLMIARSKDSLQLLLTLGYSPGWLSKNVSRQFIPAYLLVVLSAIAFTQVMQWVFHRFVMYSRPEMSSWIHWSIPLVALLLIVLSLIINFRMIKKLLYRLY